MCEFKGLELRLNLGNSVVEGGGDAFSNFHLLYNHVICIVGVSREVRFVKGGRDFVKGRRPPPFAPPLNEAL